jgi:hypothetical protein
MNKYFFEMTDTFGGELNYCWLHRFNIKEKSLRGALQKLSKETGYNFRNNGLHYKAKNACVVAYEIENEIDQTWLDKAKEI